MTTKVLCLGSQGFAIDLASEKSCDLVAHIFACMILCIVLCIEINVYIYNTCICLYMCVQCIYSISYMSRSNYINSCIPYGNVKRKWIFNGYMTRLFQAETLIHPILLTLQIALWCTRPGKRLHSYWKLSFIVNFPINNGDFRTFFVCLPGRVLVPSGCTASHLVTDDTSWVCRAVFAAASLVDTSDWAPDFVTAPRGCNVGWNWIWIWIQWRNTETKGP